MTVKTYRDTGTWRSEITRCLLRSIPFLLVFASLIYFVSTRHTIPGIPIRDGTVSLLPVMEEAEFEVSLAGEWLFAWDTFLDPADPEASGAGIVTLSVPSVWNGVVLPSGSRASGFGHATYLLRVTDATPGRPLAFRIPTFSTAYRLYADGVLVAANGTASADPAGHVPGYQPTEAVFAPRTDRFDIVVHVSNQDYARGGMWYDLHLGTSGMVRAESDRIAIRDQFLIGGLSVMGLLCLFLYGFRHERSALYFSLIAAAVSVRILINGNYPVYELFPFIGFDATVRLDYLTLIWQPVLIVLFAQAFQASGLRAGFSRLILVYGFLLTAMVLVTPIHLFTRSVYIIEAAALALVAGVAVRLVTPRGGGLTVNRHLLAGLLFLTATGLHDILFQANVLIGFGREISPVGFFFMLLCWMYSIVKNYAQTIQEREHALSRIIELSRQERESELKLLKAQISPHFVFNALNTIIAVSRSDSDRARSLLTRFSQYLRGSFDFDNLEELVPFDQELATIRAYTEIELARFGHKLNVLFDIDNTRFRIPPLILQPLVENAIVHGIRPKPEGGTICVFVREEGDCVVIGVRDDGVGMGAAGDNRIAGAGVGLANVRGRLSRLLNANLDIETGQDGGTIASIRLNKENIVWEVPAC